MEIISFPFALFTLLSLVVYHLLPRRGQNLWLLACSFYFAFTWEWKFAVILVISILINYAIGQLINRGTGFAKGWLVIGIILNAGGLVFFRVINHGLVEVLIRFLSGGNSLTTSVLLPIGFSFYTLQAIAYLVDVYKKQIPAENDLISYGLFLAYFPRLLSGPIERGKFLLPQLAKPRLVDNKMLAEGSWLIILGLFRKLVIASLLFTLMPDGIFPRPLEFAVSDRWIAVLIYSFWLYNDFAGYTALVRGISLFFGIRLSINFRQPFFAKTTLEFWNRWHISLSFWLRDYIFFPTQRFLLQKGLSARNWIRIVIPPLVTMAVSGFWHNATVSLLIWGIIHGFYQVLDHIQSLQPGFISPGKRPKIQQAFLASKIYFLLLPTWILFTAGGFKLSVSFALSLFQGGGTIRIHPLELIIPLLGLGMSFFLDHMQEKSENSISIFGFTRFSQSVYIAFAILCVLLSLLWSNLPTAAFVYQGF